MSIESKAVKELLRQIEMTCSNVKKSDEKAHEYFINILLALPIVIIENNNIPDFHAFTDMRKIYIIVNKDYKFNMEKLLFLLEHELLHILGEHERRKGDRNHELWNIACDLWINHTLVDTFGIGEYPGIQIPGDGLFFKDKIKYYSTKSEEEIYEEIINKTTFKTVSYEIDMPNEPDNHQSNSNSSQQTQKQSDNTNNKQAGNCSITISQNNQQNSSNPCSQSQSCNNNSSNAGQGNGEYPQSNNQSGTQSVSSKQTNQNTENENQSINNQSVGTSNNQNSHNDNQNGSDSQNDEQVNNQNNNQNAGNKGSLKVEVKYAEVELHGKKMMVPIDVEIPKELKPTEEQKEIFRQKVKTIVQHVENMLVNKKQRGFDNGRLNQIIDKLIKTPLPWDDILEKAINTIMTKSDSRTWAKPNIFMRRVVNKIKASTLPYYDEQENKGKLVIVVDTSGSISDTELRRFASIIYDSLDYFGEVIRVEHDVDINTIKRYKVNDELQKDMVIDDSFLSFTGRGGTSHKDVFDFLESVYENTDKLQELKLENMDDNFDPFESTTEISLIIFLTDFYSDVGEIYTKYTFHEKIPCIWCITNNDEADVPFGSVIHIQSD